MLAPTIVFVIFFVVGSSSWEGIEDFQKFGYDVLPCPTYQRSECCICKNVIEQLERLFENPGKERDYAVELASSRRPGRPKKLIPYVRSMAGIADALENVCFTNVSLDIAKAETRVTEATDMFFFTCRHFTNDFEEHIQRHAHSQARDEKKVDLTRKICVDDTKLCDSVDGKTTNPPRWYMSIDEHGQLRALLNECLETVETIEQVLSGENGGDRQGVLSSSSLPKGKRRRIRSLMSSLFFKFGAAATLTHVFSNTDKWHNLLLNDTIHENWAVVKVKLKNKIHAANSFGEDDLFVEVQQDGDDEKEAAR